MENNSILNKFEVGQRIKALRTEHGLTLEQFGNLFNPPASKSIVSRWESGKSIPSSERLKFLSNYFKVSSIYLLYGDTGLANELSQEEISILSEELSNAMNRANQHIKNRKSQFIKFLNDADFSEYNNEQLKFLDQSIRFLNTYKNDDIIIELTHIIKVINLATVEEKLNTDSFDRLFRAGCQNLLDNLKKKMIILPLTPHT